MNRITTNLLKLIEFIGLILFVSGFDLHAKVALIGVTHPQVKETLEEISKLYQWSIKPDLAFHFKGSAHEYRPSAKDLKSLMKQTYLMAGPTGHQKWLLKANNYLPSKTYFLKDTAQDHFWLNADLACSKEQELIKALLHWQLISSPPTQSLGLWCLKMRADRDQLKKLLEASGITHIILAHNALKSQLEALNLKVLVLLSDDHHSKVTTHKLKQALAWQSSKSKHLLQIKEPEIIWPSPLQNTRVKSISWSPLQKSPLKELIITLKTHRENSP
jgi:hypothetical protein